jgi:uncharacterized protein with PIN domain
MLNKTTNKTVTKATATRYWAGSHYSKTTRAKAKIKANPLYE